MQFSLSISCDNAAFSPVADDASEADRYDAAAGEVRRILRYIADCQLMDSGNRSGRLSDTNGNRCGQWSLAEEESGAPDPDIMEQALRKIAFEDQRDGRFAALANEALQGEAHAETITAETLADLADKIDAYAKECDDAEYTDTGEAWDLLNEVRETIRGEPTAPTGGTHAETATGEAERLYRVAYHPEGRSDWTLLAARYTAEEAAAEVERLQAQDRLTQIVREPR